MDFPIIRKVGSRRAVGPIHPVMERVFRKEQASGWCRWTDAPQPQLSAFKPRLAGYI